MAGIAYDLNPLPSPFGTSTLDPSSSVVAYVRATQLANQSSEVQGKWVPDIASALLRCRSGRNDIVVLMQGHTENVTATTFTNLVAGTRIVGIGRGSNRPNLRWTATTSQLALNKADCVISNVIMRCEGAVVVKAIAVTAADCAIYNCDIDFGSTATTNLSTIGLDIGVGANRFEFRNNYVHTVVDATPTQAIVISSTGDGIAITDNDLLVATSAVTKGVIDITGAATGLRICRNLIQNRVASSETCISSGAVACTGIVSENFCASEAGTPVSDLIELNAASLLRLFQNFGTDTKNTSGLLTPAVVT